MTYSPQPRVREVLRFLREVEERRSNACSGNMGDTEGDSVIAYNAERPASESPSGVRAPSLSSRVIR